MKKELKKQTKKAVKSKAVKTNKTKKNTDRRTKVFNLLKSGKKVSIQTLTKGAYGEYNVKNAKNTYTIISDLRRVRSLEINSLGEGKFQLI